MHRPDWTLTSSWSALRFALVVLALVALPQAVLGLVLGALVGPTRWWAQAIVVPGVMAVAGAPLLWRMVVRPLRDAALGEHAKYGAVLAAAGDCLFTTDEEGRIESFNGAAERLFGYTEEAMLGRDVGLLLPAATLEAGLLEPEEVVGRRKDGTTFRAELSLRGVETGDMRLFVGILRDVTDRRQAERWLEARARQQSAVATLGQEALAGRDVDAIMATAASLAAVGVGASHAAVLELLPGGKAFRLRAGVGWERDRIGRTTVSARSEVQVGFTLVSGRPVMVDDTGRDHRFNVPPLVRDHGLASCASVVIPGPHRSWGVLSVHAATPHAWGEDDVQFLASLASVLASAIAHTGARSAVADDPARVLDQVTTGTAQVSSLVEMFRHGAPHLVASLRSEMIRRATTSGRTHDLAEAEAVLHALEQDLARLEPALATLTGVAVSRPVSD
jgi:PAS domain S-box-containing protein